MKILEQQLPLGRGRGLWKEVQRGFKVVVHFSYIVLDDGYTGICFIVFTKM